VTAIRLRIKELRTKRKWSMRELARRAGIRPATLVALEHGASPRLDTLVKLADAFDVKVTQLLRED
jgi:transcriptional regulator with XRE-family HTH domain